MLRLSMIALTLIAGALCSAGTAWAGQDSTLQTVHFDGPGKLTLTGYLFLPAAPEGRVPAIVLMHGRAGAYSSLAKGRYDATTLTKRHVFWGRFWAARGYVALLVDGFGPRGYPAGFAARSYSDRPEAVNEVTVRPLDAYAALAYLRGRADVDPARIALQGWSNGGSATLAAMAETTLQAVGTSPGQAFVGALAFYPACKLHDAFKDSYRPYAPVRVFSGDDDEEVSAARCKRLVDDSRAAGGDIAITTYPGATHDFDDPGEWRQSVEANVAADEDAIPRAEAFVKDLFGR
jgi:carboxymethylenebutenolidase